MGKIQSHSKVILLVSLCQNFLENVYETRRKIRKTTIKINRRGSRSLLNTEFSHFVLFNFAEDGKEMNQEL